MIYRGHHTTRSLSDKIHASLGDKISYKLIPHVEKICKIKLSLILFKNLQTNYNLVDFTPFLRVRRDDLFFRARKGDSIVEERIVHPAYEIIMDALYAYHVTECYTLIDSKSQDSLFNYLKNNTDDESICEKLSYKGNLIFEDLHIRRGTLIGHASIERFVDGILNLSQKDPSADGITAETYLEEIIRIFDEILRVDLGIDFSLKNFCDSIDNTYLYEVFHKSP